MARKKKGGTARLHIVRHSRDHVAARSVVMAFRTTETEVDVPLSSGVSDADVRRARELARTHGWTELVAS
jgi:hypothetical protein